MSFGGYTPSNPSSQFDNNNVLPWDYATEGAVPDYQHGLAQAIDIDLTILGIGDPAWKLIGSTNDMLREAKDNFPWAFIAHAGKETELQSRLLFQTLPEQVIETKQANYSSIPIVGRSEPYRVYAGNSPRVFNFDLMFAASINQFEDKMTTSRVMVERIRWLQSNLYPQRTREYGMVTHPPVLNFSMAHLHRVRCILTRCTVTWLQPWDLFRYERKVMSNEDEAETNRTNAKEHEERRAKEAGEFADMMVLKDTNGTQREKDPDYRETMWQKHYWEADKYEEFVAEEETLLVPSLPMFARVSIELEEVAAVPYSNVTFLRSHPTAFLPPVDEKGHRQRYIRE
jgi:hypothetical protein